MLLIFFYILFFVFNRPPEIDFSELESLFSAAVPNSDQGGSGRKGGSRATLGQKSEKVQLVSYILPAFICAVCVLLVLK